MDCPKKFKIIFFALEDGKNCVYEGDLELEGGRAFLIYQYWPVGKKEIKEKIEIDPLLLQETPRTKYDFFYRAQIAIPKPKDN